LQLSRVADLSVDVNSTQTISDLSKADIFDRQEFCPCGNPLPLPTANGGRPFQYCSEPCRKLAHSINIKSRNGHKWTKGQRQEILERDGYICIYCGKPTTGIDHAIPIKLGGKTEKSNGVACCRSCNSSKSSYLDLRAIVHLIAKGESFGLSSEVMGIIWRDSNRIKLVQS